MQIRGIDQDRFAASLQESGWDRLWRKLVLQALATLQDGQLVIEDPQGTLTLGEPAADGLRAHLVIEHMAVYRKLMFGGSVGAAEAYMAGAWRTPCLTSVVRLLARNIEQLNRLDDRWPWLQTVVNRIAHSFNANTLKGSRRNIAAHYDLGNDFFELFLDQRMMYSAAVYPSAEATLEEASWHKCDLICRKLNLQPGDHLLEIGTGWGGMAIHAAKHYGCRVTTTTLSQEQLSYAREWVEREGLSDRITLLHQDYRELEGEFDKLVSVEMIEAVGHEYYETYFRKCASLLKTDGLMLIQAITIADQRYEAARRSVDFIQKYIFPGGGLPSMEVISRCLSRATDLNLVDLQDIGGDYARTLAEWRARFHARHAEVRRQGFDEPFCRMWDFYLAYCEGGFRERTISTVQLVMAKPRAVLPVLPHQ
ncbi:cyclopropane-fatty-acyl-phospholipid synthase family protein [Pseudomaricurvus sp. HS19]|uniref:SAM-dependent methyltransferase n=1 Tax=Pseudomaricurvus sp. HS19 TaxID=2692626 RepID=UPI001367FE4E|nr:cyclopropane-fatty-acyl-phospholipid synthase family protein [Pseudomaricurvus sp. HS19]MYM62893.1 methyltransferase domain-containing protein [Pseudomaricurvus sp. HS19]